MWNLDQWFRRRCRLKTFRIWSSGGPFIMWSVTICAILVEGIKRNNSAKLFSIWTSVSGGDTFKRYFLSGALAALMFSGAEPFVQFLKMASWGRTLRNNFEFGLVVQKLFKDISYLELWQPFCSAEQNHLCNFGREYLEEQFCEIILNLDQWFRRRCVLKIFLIWSFGDHFVHLSRTICAILVECIMRNNSVKIFWTWTSGSRGDVV